MQLSPYMRTTSICLCTIIAAAVGLAPAGCKKNEESPRATTEDKATTDDKMSVEGRKSAEPRRTAQPPRVEPTSGAAISAKYTVCTGYVSAGNWDKFRSDCITDDYVGHEVDDRDIRGPEGVVEQFKNLKTAFPDLKLEPQLVMVSGRDILAIMLMTGTHEKPLKTPTGEIAATNKKVGQLFFHRLAVTNDLKAKEEWVFSDMGTMMSQLGQMPREAVAMRSPIDKGIDGAPITLITADDEKERANIETVKKLYTAFNSRNLNDLMALWTDDAVLSDQAMPADFKGKQEVEKMNKNLGGAFSDGKVETPSLLAAGDYVVAIGKFNGTNDGAMPDLKVQKTGKKVEVSFADVVHLKDGKIAHLWRFRNGMALAKQLGTIPEGGKMKMDERGKMDQPTDPAKQP